MQRQAQIPMVSSVFSLILVSLACATLQPTPTITPEPTATFTASPTATQTRRPSPTPRPTRTPNLAATQQAEGLQADVQAYHAKGYLTTTAGEFIDYDDFDEECDSYCGWLLNDRASDFFMTAHFKWSSAYRSAGLSGCGFLFGIQDNANQDHYAVFLDRSKVYFLQAGYYAEPLGPTRGSGRVDFANPADDPVEADFTLIVKDAYAYVLVDDKLTGEYTLSQSRVLRGEFGLAVLSGTKRDYGTRCEMTNLHAWIPEE
ncbi:MAG: hypothetical protein EHM40_11300 [Chloroflexi bacterium]|nr:MAG: hypothetical protein EHM40_11300 [Chloroflexota bacterium]